MVAGESSMGQVFDAKAIIRVVPILSLKSVRGRTQHMKLIRDQVYLLDVYPSFSGLGALGFLIVNHRPVPRLLLLISLIGRRILVNRQL